MNTDEHGFQTSIGRLETGRLQKLAHMAQDRPARLLLPGAFEATGF
jgi:hypothetical protein